MLPEMTELPEAIGPYDVRAVLGQGAMGVVYRATGPCGDRAAGRQALAQTERREGMEFFRERRSYDALVAALREPTG